MSRIPALFPAEVSWIKRALLGRRRPPESEMARLLDRALWPTPEDEPELDLSHTPLTELPRFLYVGGDLILKGCWRLTELPRGMVVDGSLDLEGCVALRALPEDIMVGRHINLSGCRRLEKLPDRLSGSGNLYLDGCVGLTRLPSRLRLRGLLSLRGCTGLKEITTPLQIGDLDACPEHPPRTFLFWEVPEGSVDFESCRSLAVLPEQMRIRGNLSLAQCARLQALPKDLFVGGSLDLTGCASLRVWPSSLQVKGSIEMAGTQLPRPVHIRRDQPYTWKGVQVPDWLVYDPSSLKASDILLERNAALRGVMIERMGLRRFLAAIKPQVLHSDQDRGGPRHLLKVDLNGDDPLLCLSVRCPSTRQLYLLRVPPAMRTCRQAAAWLAGFDNPGQYFPLTET